MTAAYRDERREFQSPLDEAFQFVRLLCVSDALLAQVCYRAKARLRALGVPLLPWILHRAAITIAQVAIGDPVVIAPGLYLFHGQVVIDGFTEIGRGVLIAPFVTIGLREGVVTGPKISGGVWIGTGAKILGPIRVGTEARIGANAVVVKDVPPHATVTGVPGEVRGLSD